MPHRRHEYHDALSATHARVMGGGGPGNVSLVGKPTFRVAVGKPTFRVALGRHAPLVDCVQRGDEYEFARARAVTGGDAADDIRGIPSHAQMEPPLGRIYYAEGSHLDIETAPAEWKLGRAAGTADGTAASTKWDALAKGARMYPDLEKVHFDPDKSEAWIEGYNVGYHETEPFPSAPLTKSSKALGAKSDKFKDGYGVGKEDGKVVRKEGGLSSLMAAHAADAGTPLRSAMPNYDADESSDWRKGYLVGFSSAFEDRYLRTASFLPKGTAVYEHGMGNAKFVPPPNMPGEPAIPNPDAIASKIPWLKSAFEPPPNAPGAQAMLPSAWKWGLGFTAVGLIGYGGWRWYQTRNATRRMP
jgi:hypothetical protein